MSRYIKIGNERVLQCNEFTPAKEFVYAGEYTTCLGEARGDYIGWRYAPTTLQWDSLPQSQLMILNNINGPFELTFTDPKGQTVTEMVMPVSQAESATRHIRSDGTAVWKNVVMEVRFVDVHHS